MRILNKIIKRLSISMVLLFLTIFFPNILGATSEIDLLDFGQVLVGTSSTKVIPITNLDNEKEVMLNFTFREGICDFSLDQQLIFIPPGQKISFDINFSPAALGTCSDLLFIMYSYGQSETIEVRGEGVDEITQDTIPDTFPDTKDVASLLEFFDRSVRSSSSGLIGNGPGKSANRRLNALRNMIVRARILVENGSIDEAVGQLNVVLKKIAPPDLDGTESPKYFVTGNDAERLADLVQQVIDNLTTL
jgi:hypothetical protein